MQIQTLLWSRAMISQIQAALSDGTVLVGTSDTVFGLLALPTQEGFDALNRIKGRSEKPYLIVAGSPNKALDLCAQENQKELMHCMQACWPGPVTMIVKAKESVPAYMKSKNGTIAIRVPDHAGFTMLLKEIPYLFSTSANLAGKPVPHVVQDLDPSIVDQCEYLILDEQETIRSSEPSTIIDCTTQPFTVVRQGAVSLADLKNKCGDMF